MLENLTQRLSRVVKTIRGEARLTEANTQEMLREVRLALLEADVSLPVVREFVANVKEKALGADVVGSLSPGQALVGVVHRELTALMGGDLGPDASELSLAMQSPAIILMAGLQGAGKTTTEATQKPIDIARSALDYAKRHHFDVLIVDTAGRLGIDEEMMREIRELHEVLKPIETLFVVDAMQGQDAVNTARAFADALPLTGVVLTKLDGDARGGAALSVRHVTGKPLKFVGVSEKLDGLEPFHPERMAQRVLGMGDILSLVEQAQQNIDVAEANKFAAKIKSGDKFDLNDFKEQLAQVKKMGDMSSMLEKLPAQFAQAAGQLQSGQAEKQMRRTEGIINSMTPLERSKPELLKASRKRRIATGAGVPVQEVNRMLNQFEQMQGMMKQMKKGGMAKMMRAMGGMKNLGKLGGFGR